VTFFLRYNDNKNYNTYLRYIVIYIMYNILLYYISQTHNIILLYIFYVLCVSFINSFLRPFWGIFLLIIILICGRIFDYMFYIFVCYTFINYHVNYKPPNFGKPHIELKLFFGESRMIDRVCVFSLSSSWQSTKTHYGDTS